MDSLPAFLPQFTLRVNPLIPTNEFMINNNNTRKSAKTAYAVPRCRTNIHLYSFYPSAIRLWNNIPENIKNKDLEGFKEGCKNIQLRCTNDH